MALTDAQRQDIERLFEYIELGSGPTDDPNPLMPAVTIGVRPGETFSLSGDGYYLLRRLQWSLAAPAVEGGVSMREAETLLYATCTRFVTEGAEEALRWLTGRLEEPSKPWTVLRAVRVYSSNASVKVGKCTIQRGLPPRNEGPWPDAWQEEFPGYTIAVDVMARHQSAAMVLADQLFAEAIGVLEVGDRRERGGSLLGDQVAVLSETGGELSRGGASLYARTVDDNGTLWPSAQSLSRAAEKEDAERTDWERRTLAATRWFSAGLSAALPTDALVNFMVALECLFVEDRGVSAKGQTIAEEVTKRWSASSLAPEGQTDWLADLYRRRNDIVHEGKAYQNEIDVERLTGLTWEAVAWAAWHLNQFHSLASKPCATFIEALADHGIVRHRFSSASSGSKPGIDSPATDA